MRVVGLSFSNDWWFWGALRLPGMPRARRLTARAALALGLLRVALCCVPGASRAVELEKKRVFYLNSYHNGYVWSDQILEGIRNILATSKVPVELQIEYMDTKKYDYDAISKHLAEIFLNKFSGEHLDVVIVSDNAALMFIKQYGDSLFPGIPVVFCGINDYDLELVKGVKNMTGVLENIDVAALLETALIFHPHRRKLLAVGDNSLTGLAIKRQIQRVEPLFKNRLSFEYLSVNDFNNTLAQLNYVPEDTILYFIPFYTSVKGRFFSADELTEVLSQNTNAPIYSNWEFLLGHGTVGGPLLSSVHHGETAAGLALRILDGEHVADIPVLMKPPHRYMFDYNVVKKLGIDMNLIPKNAIFINEPEAFYQLNKKFFWTIMVFVVALLVILALLARNVMRRRAVEGEVKAQLSFMETLLNTIPLLICWKDTKQRFLGVNKSYLDFFALPSLEAILNKTHDDLPSPVDYREEMQRLEENVAKTGNPLRKHKIFLQDSRGETVWLEINKVPLLNEQGAVFGTLSTAENITREANLERQLLQSQKMEAIGTLAGGIAHDFNNILTSIINSTELVLEGQEEGSLSRRDLERVLAAASRGSSVVKQILTFSRPNKEGFITADLTETVQEVLNLLGRSLPRNITVEKDIRAQNTILRADPTQMHQVLMNLCTNSYHALGDSGGVIRISLTEDPAAPDWAEALGLPHGRYLKLTVSDNGPGIAPEIMDKVFDPFFTTKGKADGTGLGLAVVHGIVKAHKGAVRLRSVPWVDTSMEIFLPLTASEENMQSASEGLALQGQERLLFVEDDDDQLATTPRLLESLGYTVTSLKDPGKAVELLSRHGLDGGSGNDFDLLITDFDMPGINGLDLARAVGKVRPGLPIILVSGREHALEISREVDNIASVLLKPYNKTNLSEAIRQVLA